MNYEIITLILYPSIPIVYIVGMVLYFITKSKAKEQEKEMEMEERKVRYYTVESLKNTLEDLINQGCGNKYVIVPCDEEGNDYRALGDQAVLKTKEDIEEYLGREGKDASSLYLNIEDCIVL